MHMGETMLSDSAAYLTNLHNLLNHYFGEDEIDMLCFQMGIDRESIAGNSKPARIRELIISLGRKGRLPELVQLARQERPNVSWPSVSSEFQLPDSIASPSSLPAVVNNYYGEVVQGNVVKKTGGVHVEGNLEMSGGSLTGRDSQLIQGDQVSGSQTVHAQSETETIELARSLAALLNETARHAPAISPKVRVLQAELYRDEEADDELIADLIADIAEAAPSAVDHLAQLFANPTATKAFGPATKYALRRMKKSRNAYPSK
jgi:hypothetical protein